MLKSPYVRGLVLLTFYVCFEAAFVLFPDWRRRDGIGFWWEAFAGATLLGLFSFSQFCRYVGSALMLLQSILLGYLIASDYATVPLSAYKAGRFLMFPLVGQVLFGFVTALYLLSPIFGREFVSLRDNPEKRPFDIERVYRIASIILLLITAIFANQGMVRLVLGFIRY